MVGGYDDTSESHIPTMQMYDPELQGTLYYYYCFIHKSKKINVILVWTSATAMSISRAAPVTCVLNGKLYGEIINA